MKNITPTTVIIYLIGKPGVGKYTIAEELAAKHGFIVCDNQLVNHPIFELLQYNGYATIPDFAWDSIDRIRTEILVPSPSSDQPWGGQISVMLGYIDLGISLILGMSGYRMTRKILE